MQRKDQQHLENDNESRFRITELPRTGNIFMKQENSRDVIFSAGDFYNDPVVRSVLVQSTDHSGLNPVICAKFSKVMGLRLAGQPGESEQENASAVCYANSEEVTDAFKIELPPESFSEVDVLDYVCGILNEKAEKGSKEIQEDMTGIEIPYPSCQVGFWKWAADGSIIRKKYFSATDQG